MRAPPPALPVSLSLRFFLADELVVEELMEEEASPLLFKLPSSRLLWLVVGGAIFESSMPSSSPLSLLSVCSRSSGGRRGEAGGGAEVRLGTSARGQGSVCGIGGGGEDETGLVERADPPPPP